MILVVDGDNLLYRAVYAAPEMDARQAAVIAIKSMASALSAVVSADRCIVVFGGGISERRRRIFPGYKVRKYKDEAEKEKHDHAKLQFMKTKALLRPILRDLGVRILEMPMEADDLIAFVVTRDPEKNYVIVSEDRDFLQLVWKNVQLFRPASGERVILDMLDDYLGYPHDFFLLWKALVGDPSDGVHGILGIGEKRATEAIKDYVESDSSRAGLHRSEQGDIYISDFVNYLGGGMEGYKGKVFNSVGTGMGTYVIGRNVLLFNLVLAVVMEPMGTYSQEIRRVCFGNGSAQNLPAASRFLAGLGADEIALAMVSKFSILRGGRADVA